MSLKRPWGSFCAAELPVQQVISTEFSFGPPGCSQRHVVCEHRSESRQKNCWVCAAGSTGWGLRGAVGAVGAVGGCQGLLGAIGAAPSQGVTAAHVTC